jgi:phenylacetate-CoA ligase
MSAKVLASGFSHLVTKRWLGPFWFRRLQLQKTQWLSAGELEGLQLKLLKRMLTHCYDNVPYYRKVMDECGISVDGIRSLRDIARFPIMTKEEVLRAGCGLIAVNYWRSFLYTAYTGGSTGPRLPLKRDPASIGNEHAFLRRQYDWADIGMRDVCAYLTWRSVAKPNEKNGKYYSYDPFMKELILSTFHLREANVPKYLEAMRRYGVKALVGYPSAAVVMAQVLLARGESFPLRSVLTSSEMLGDKERATISEAFECPVYDFYGNAERVCCIHTCEKGGYHVIPEYGLTELVRADFPNDDCFRIVATGFWNKAMPLVRYDTGDLVERGEGECPCRRQFPVIKRIVGRECKTIRTASGLALGLTAISRLFKNALLRLYSLPIVESQFILEESGGVVFEYIPRADFDEHDDYMMRKALTEELPGDIRLEITKVSMGTRTGAGKSVSLVRA